MPVIHGATAPRFTLDGTAIVGLAAPSRGSTELSSWRIALEPGVQVPAHILNNEEVFIVLEGSAIATLDGARHDVTAGDALVVPPGVRFELAVGKDTGFTAVCSMAAGGTARFAEGDGAPFPPPWSV